MISISPRGRYEDLHSKTRRLSHGFHGVHRRSASDDHRVNGSTRSRKQLTSNEVETSIARFAGTASAAPWAVAKLVRHRTLDPAPKVRILPAQLSRETQDLRPE